MAIIHEDEKTSLVRKLLEKGKSLSYIRERFSEEFDDSLELIQIYNVLRTIAKEQYLERKRTKLAEHRFFPELRIVLKHEPTSEIFEERSSQNWRVLLNSRGKFLIYHKDSFVGETDFGLTISDFELNNDYLVVLTSDNLCPIYLPSFKTLKFLSFGSDKPVSLDRDFLYFSDFRQKYTLDEYGETQLGIVEKGKFEKQRKKPLSTQEKIIIEELEKEQIQKLQEIDKIEIVYLLSNGDLNKLVFEFVNGKEEVSNINLESSVNTRSIVRVRFLSEGDKIEVKLLKSPTEILIDSTQNINYKIRDRYSLYISHHHTQAIVNQDSELVFLSDYDGKTKVSTPLMNFKEIEIRKFYSVHQIGSIYYILTATEYYEGFCIFKWNGSLNVKPEMIYCYNMLFKKSPYVISADLHVHLKSEEKTKKNEAKFEADQKQKTTQPKTQPEFHITQNYTNVEYLRLIRDMLFVASEDRLLKAWTLEGEYLGVVTKIGNFRELREFIKPRNDVSGFVIDDTLVFIGNNWLSGSRGYSDHVNICLGGIPEFHFKEQFLKVYSTTLSDAYQTIAGGSSDASN